MKRFLLILKRIYSNVLNNFKRKSKKDDFDSPDQMYPLW